MEYWELEQKQSLPLEQKVIASQQRIKEWYNHWRGDVYVAFSGGKDSTALLNIVRSVYPDTPAVFVDTGLEYPEIREFVKTVENVTWLKPKMSFKKVIDEYGYPIISKEVSKNISRFRGTKSQSQKEYRLGHGLGKVGIIPKKYQYLINAPFKISDMCCHKLKKEPFYAYNKETGRKPFLGIMANDSNKRKMSYLKTGCNAFETKHPQSLPIGFWNDVDIWKYLKKYSVHYCSIYDKGEVRTGCIFCLFGIQQTIGENRIQRLARTHPNLYKYCLNQIGLKNVMSFMGVSYKPVNQTTLDGLNSSDNSSPKDT